MGKWLIPGLEQGKYKLNLKHHLMPENKEMLNKQWGHAITWMNRKNVMLSERIVTQKTYCIILSTRSSRMDIYDGKKSEQ